MSNEMIDSDGEITRTSDAVANFNPFSRSEGGERAIGASMMSARENTEVLAMVMSAKRFPRDVVKAADRIMNAFTRPTLAEKSQYQFARGGSDITGPSIRAAEAMSQQWGNMSNGWRELNRYKGADGVGVSECEAYCIDYESNSREAIQFVVRHWRDTKRGGYALSDERDIYELCANQSQRRKRACILAQIPGDVVEAAMEQASTTLKAKADTTPEGLKALEATFAEFGITRELLEKRIQRRLDTITPAQVVSLKRIYVSMRDEMSSPQDWFDIAPEQVKSERLDAVRAAAKQKREGGKKGAKSAPHAQHEAATASDGARAGDSAQAVEQTSATGEGLFDDTQYADFADRITKAKDGDAAAVALDQARTALSPKAHEDLTKLWVAKWTTTT